MIRSLKAFMALTRLHQQIGWRCSDPHLSATTPQRAEIVLVDGLLGLGAAPNAGWPR